MRTATLIIGMYVITFTLFMCETGNVWKAASFGLIAASLKSAFSWGHYTIWDRYLNRNGQMGGA